MGEKIQSRINLQNAYLLFYTVQNCFTTLGRCFKQVANAVFHSKNGNPHSYTGEKKNPIQRGSFDDFLPPLMSPNMKPQCRGAFPGLKKVDLWDTFLWSFWWCCHPWVFYIMLLCCQHELCCQFCPTTHVLSRNVRQIVLRDVWFLSHFLWK